MDILENTVENPKGAEKVPSNDVLEVDMVDVGFMLVPVLGFVSLRVDVHPSCSGALTLAKVRG